MPSAWTVLPSALHVAGWPFSLIGGQFFPRSLIISPKLVSTFIPSGDHPYHLNSTFLNLQLFVLIFFFSSSCVGLANHPLTSRWAASKPSYDRHQCWEEFRSVLWRGLRNQLYQGKGKPQEQDAVRKAHQFIVTPSVVEPGTAERTGLRFRGGALPHY